MGWSGSGEGRVAQASQGSIALSLVNVVGQANARLGPRFGLRSLQSAAQQYCQRAHQKCSMHSRLAAITCAEARL